MNRHGRQDERGSMAVEMVILTVPLVVILVFLAALGRFSDGRNQVDEAARDAAREASTYLTPPVATAQGDQVADAELSGVCAHPDITIDTSQLHPGGQVTATVRCNVPVGDLLLLKLPGTDTVTATSSAVVDTYVQAAP
jgi:Flp pilus assembly protein TadG